MVVEVDFISDEGEVVLPVKAMAGLAGSSMKIHVTASRHRNNAVI